VNMFRAQITSYTLPIIAQITSRFAPLDKKTFMSPV
jgi:hypothetical protein